MADFWLKMADIQHFQPFSAKIHPFSVKPSSATFSQNGWKRLNLAEKGWFWAEFWAEFGWKWLNFNQNVWKQLLGENGWPQGAWLFWLKVADFGWRWLSLNFEWPAGTSQNSSMLHHYLKVVPREYHDPPPWPRRYRTAGIPRPPPLTSKISAPPCMGGGRGVVVFPWPQWTSIRGSTTSPAHWFSRPPSYLLTDHSFYRGGERVFLFWKRWCCLSGTRHFRHFSSVFGSEEQSPLFLRVDPKNLFGLFLTFRVIFPYSARFFLETLRKDPLKQAQNWHLSRVIF